MNQKDRDEVQGIRKELDEHGGEPISYNLLRVIDRQVEVDKARDDLIWRTADAVGVIMRRFDQMWPGATGAKAADNLSVSIDNFRAKVIDTD